MYEPASVAENIKKQAKLLKVQLKDMLIALHLNKNTLSNMYSGSMLKGDSLARIADYLDCSVDYLLGRKKEQPTPINEGRLSETALRFAELVDRLTPDQQELLLCQIQAWIAQDRKQASAAPQSAGETDPGSDP